MNSTVGGLPILSRIWDLHPLATYLWVMFADFGVICILMALEGKMPWNRPLYKAFLMNDTLFIPLFVAMAAVALHSTDRFDGLYIQQWLHWALLAFGFAFSFFMEYGALQSGFFTWGQEWSPSKLWHTVIFGVMAYWLLYSLIILAVTRRPTWAVALALVAIVGFGTMNYLDNTKFSRPYDNVHREGTYIPWEWHDRIEEGL